MRSRRCRPFVVGWWLSGCRRCDRKVNSESGSISRGALHLNGTSIGDDNGPDQTQAKTVAGCGTAAVATVKTFKDFFFVLRLNSASCIRHYQRQSSGLFRYADFHPASGRGELDGVVQQIPEHPLHGSSVGFQKTLFLIGSEFQVDALCLRRGQKDIHRLLRDFQ